MKRGINSFKIEVRKRMKRKTSCRVKGHERTT